MDDTGTTVVDGAGARSPVGRAARGASIDRYLVLEVLGEGGMGVIYRAYDPNLDRQVALKCLRPTKSSGVSEHARERLVREAQALAQLQHPNVVAVHDVGIAGEDVFIAMELVEGQTLGKWLAVRPSIAAICGVFVAAGAGLAAAHRAGIVHRDFKPENVIIGADGRVRVIDFGLARPPTDSEDIAMPEDSRTWNAEALTHAGAIVGTPAYMAPEQYRGEADALSDQFSFGISLFEAVYGKRPFRGANREALARAIERGVVDEPAGGRVSAGLRRIIRRALSPDRKARYASMDELLGDLRRSTRSVRNRIAAGVAAAIVVPGIALGALHFARSDEPACEGGDARLAGTWDAHTRAAIADAFRRAGSPYADESSRQVADLLDTYTRSAIHMQRESCLATTVRKEQSSELFDLGMACLDRRWAELRVVTRELAAARNSEVVTGAVQAVRGLPALEPCADAKALRGAFPPPNAAQAQSVAAARALLDESHALYLTGDHARGGEIAGRAVTLARSASYPPAIAEAMLEQGIQRRSAASVEDEAAHWRATVLAAAEARDDVRAAKAWTQLMLGSFENDPKGALALETATEAAIVRADNDPSLRADMLTAKGAAYDLLGKDQESLAAYRAALESAEKVGPTDSNIESLAGAHINLGTKLDRTGDTGAARKHLEEGTAMMIKALGPHHPQVAACKYNLGDSLMNRDQYDDAERNLLEADEIWEKAYGPNYRYLASGLTDLGLIASYRGNHASARKQLERAVQIMEKEFGPDHLSVANTYEAFGRVLAGAGDVEGANTQLRRGIAIRAKEGVKDSEEIAWAYAQLADAAVGAKKYAEARAIYETAMAGIEKAEGKEGQAAGTMWVGIAQCDVAMGRFAAAAEEASRAIELLQKAGPAKLSLARAHFALARARWQLGTDHAAAIALGRQAFDEFRSVGEYFLDERSDVEKWLTQRTDR